MADRGRFPFRDMLDTGFGTGSRRAGRSFRSLLIAAGRT